MQPFDHSSGHTFTSGNAEIYYECHGKETNPTLLFLHGGFSHIEEYNTILSVLPEQYRVIGIDSRFV